MKFIEIFYLLIILCLANCQYENAFIKGALKTNVIDTLLKNEVIDILENTLPCFNIDNISEKVDKSVFKLDLELNNLQIPKIQVPKELFSLQFFHDDDPLKISKQRCEADNSQGCELQGNIYYAKCQKNFIGQANKCIAQCPAGFSDTGLTCNKPTPYGRGTGYPWKFGDGKTLEKAKERCELANPELGCEQYGEIYYPKCKAKFHSIGCCICSPDCPSGFTDLGEFCDKPDDYQRFSYQDKYSNVIQVKIHKFSCEMTGQMSVTVNGVTVMNQDQLQADIGDTDLIIVIGVGMQENNKIALNFDQIDLQIGSFNTTIKGGLEAKIVTEILKITKNLISKEIEQIVDHIGSSITPMINDKLKQVPSTFKVGQDMEIQYKLLEIPETYPDLIKYYLNGTVNFLDSVNSELIQQEEDSYGIDFNESVTLEIRDTGINQIIQHAFDHNKLVYEQDLNIKEGWVEVKHMKVDCINSAPLIKITPGYMKTTVDGELYLDIKVDHLTNVHTYKFSAKFDLILHAEIKNNKLIITIKEFKILDLHALDSLPHLISKIIDKLVNIIIAKIVPQINSKLPQIVIPTQFDGVVFQSENVEFITDYIVAETNLTYDDKALQKNMQDYIFKAIEDPAIQSKIKISNLCTQKSFYEEFQ